VSDGAVDKITLCVRIGCQDGGSDTKTENLDEPTG